MSKLVNWDWNKESTETDDIEDMFIQPKSNLKLPIDSSQILTREDLLKLSIDSDLEASKETFDFSIKKQGN